VRRCRCAFVHARDARVDRLEAVRIREREAGVFVYADQVQAPTEENPRPASRPTRGARRLLPSAIALFGCSATHGAEHQTIEMGKDSRYGLAAQISAFRPAPRAPSPEELQGVSMPPGSRLERVLGQYDIMHAAVMTAAFAPDGRTAVSVGRAGDLVVWDVVSRAEKARFARCREGAGDTTALAVSIDGSAVAIADSDGWVCIRGLPDGRVIRSWAAHDAPIRTLAVTRRGDLFSYGYQPREFSEAKPRVILKTDERDGRVRRWRFDSEGVKGEFAIGSASAVEVAPDGSSVAALTTDGRLRVWDVEGRRLWTAARPSPGRFAFVTGHRLLILEAARIHVLDAVTGNDLGEVVRTTPVAKPLLSWMAPPVWSDCLVVTPDGRQAITSLTRDGYVFVWDVEAKREAAHVAGQDLGACWGNASFSPDGSVLMTAGEDRLRLWDFSRTAPLSDRAIHIVASSADGTRIVTYGDDREARVWDLQSGMELTRWSARAVTSLAFSADSHRVVESSAEGRGRILDAASGAVIDAAPRTGADDPAAVKAPPPALITVSQERNGMLIRVHRRIQSDVKEILVGGTVGGVSSTAVTPDGARLIAGTVRGVILVFKL